MIHSPMVPLPVAESLWSERPRQAPSKNIFVGDDVMVNCVSRATLSSSFYNVLSAPWDLGRQNFAEGIKRASFTLNRDVHLLLASYRSGNLPTLGSLALETLYLYQAVVPQFLEVIAESHGIKNSNWAYIAHYCHTRLARELSTMNLSKDPDAFLSRYVKEGRNRILLAIFCEGRKLSPEFLDIVQDCIGAHRACGSDFAASLKPLFFKDARTRLKIDLLERADILQGKREVSDREFDRIRYSADTLYAFPKIVRDLVPEAGGASDDCIRRMLLGQIENELDLKYYYDERVLAIKLLENASRAASREMVRNGIARKSLRFIVPALLNTGKRFMGF